MPQAVPVLDVVDLFPELRAELLRVLRGLNDGAWQLPTACAGWSVKDVALHILADELGYLSRHRDSDGITFESHSFDGLVALINEQNDLWVRATRRLSKRVLLGLLETTGAEMADYIRSIDPQQGSHTIAWAGTGQAPMWLQLARELTEYWMHHQHICEALGIESLKTRRYLHPVLSTFVHALPRTYADTPAPLGTVVVLRVLGEAADTWYLRREEAGWSLYAEVEARPAVTVTMSDDTAWRLFTKGITPQEAAAYSRVDGYLMLGRVMFNAVAILA